MRTSTFYHAIVSRPGYVVGLLAVSIFYLPASQLSAQSNGPSDARRIKRVAAELTRVSSVRELSDGRVLFTDTQERAAFIVPRTGPPQQFGRSGDGPGEYRQPTDLYALGSDTTLLVDGSARRWLGIVGARMVDLPPQWQGAGLSLGGEVYGMARNGWVLRLAGYAVGDPSRSGCSRYAGQPGVADSVRVVRRHIASGREDTVQTIGGAGRFPCVRKAASKGASFGRIMSHPLPASDYAVMFGDGAVAIAYHSPYRVEWLLPNGEQRAGTPVAEARRIALTPALKREILADRYPTPDGNTVFTPTDFPNWAGFVPPFTRRLTDALHAGHDGNLYINRTRIPGYPPLVDVFDRSGNRIRQLRLPDNSYVVGSGASGLYVVTKDRDDLEYLDLYAYR